MKFNFKSIFSFVAVALLIIVGFLLITSKAEEGYLNIAGQKIKIEIADTPEAQSRGLSGRKSLPETEGMLFVFEQPGKYAFWMKDMNFAIDMIWLTEDLKVVFIKKNATPDSYPTSFVPEENAQYVLEVVSGFADKHGLEVGDEAELIF